MKAELRIDTEDEIKIYLFPTTEAEKLILLKLAESETATVLKIDKIAFHYSATEDEKIESVVLTPS